MEDLIIIVGASVRSAAESATKSGWRVIAMDQFGDADTLLNSEKWMPLPTDRDFRSALAICPGIPIIPVGGFESWYPELDLCRDRNPILAPDPRVVYQVRSPEFLKEIADSSSLAFPTWTRKIAQRANRPPGDRWLVKSPQSAAGLGVKFHISGDVTAVEGAPGIEQTYLQRFAPGRPYGAAFLASATHAHLLGISRILTRSTLGFPFLYSGSVGPIAFRNKLVQQLQAFGNLVRLETGIRGLFGVDFLLDEGSQKLWLLEINPRYTASMELLEPVVGRSLMDQHIRCYADDAFGREGTTGTANLCVIKKILWAPATCVWQQEKVETVISQNTDRAARAGEKLCGTLEVTCHDRPADSSEIAVGNPLATLKARIPSETNAARVYRNMLRLEQQIVDVLRKAESSSSR